MKGKSHCPAASELRVFARLWTDCKYRSSNLHGIEVRLQFKKRAARDRDLMAGHFAFGQRSDSWQLAMSVY
jgi:hypothetical protein